MLGYMTTSFREHPRLRRQVGRRLTSAMEQRLIELGVMDAAGTLAPNAAAEHLYAVYARGGGDTRTTATLQEEGRRKVIELRDRGWDLGYADDPEGSYHARLDKIYTNACHALYATLDDGVIHDVSPRHVRVRTLAADRDDYLAHPPRGERLRDEDAQVLASLYESRRPQVQFVISDGLNANAANEHLRSVLPRLRRALAQAGRHVGETDVIIRNGRVRAGYHVGALVDAAVVVHFIGERPGTGLNTLSAYLTYGRDASGGSRWGANLNHSWTTAVCGIHPQGRAPAAAVDEIARSIHRMFLECCSGVALHARPLT
jgi:ethanolamine ammonia-lyase large subunit